MNSFSHGDGRGRGCYIYLFPDVVRQFAGQFHRNLYQSGYYSFVEPGSLIYHFPNAVRLNYTNAENNDDHKNKGFKGGYYNFTDAPGKCTTFGSDNNYTGALATGWRLPT